MKQEEYVRTIAYKVRMFNLGLDDYGQQYFIEYVDSEGNLQEFGVGAYCSDYMEAIEYIVRTRI